MPNHVMEVISGIVGELKQIASSDSVVGEAITVGNKTVIPIVKVTVGFGAGGGEGESEKAGGGFGAGGGGGCIVEPAAFIIMDETGISLLPAKPGKIDSIVEAIPGVVNKLVNIKDKLKKSDKGGKVEADDASGEDE
ncbi:MAG: spore germination protein GerW family protein [Candidatus Zixiibacteriota bacterium]